MIAFTALNVKQRAAALKARPVTMLIKRPKFKDVYIEADADNMVKKLGVDFLDGTFCIHRIDPGGWAEQQGLKPGDMCIEV